MISPRSGSTTAQAALLRLMCQVLVALASICLEFLGCHTLFLAFPDLSSPGDTGHSDQKQISSVYPYFKTFQWLCSAQKIKSQILNMTHETLYNQAFTVSLASSPKHVVLKFFPLIMFPLVQVTPQTCFFFPSPWEWCCHPPGFSYPRESSCPFLLFPGTALIPVSLYPQDHADPKFTIHYYLDMSLTILHFRITLFNLFLFYNTSVILLITASASSVWVSYKSRASPGLSLQNYWYLGFRVVKII